MPGPDILYVLTESIHKGKKTGISIAIGLCSGILIHTGLIITGFSVFIRDSKLLLDIIKIIGALYIAFLCYKSLFESDNTQISYNSGGRNRPVVKNIIKGFLMNVLNPKVTFFFIAFFPKVVGVLLQVELAIKFYPKVHWVGFSFQDVSIYTESNLLVCKVIAS